MASTAFAPKVGSAVIRRDPSTQEVSTVRNPKPKWWLLYGMGLLAAVLLMAVHFAVPSGGFRALAEGIASLAIIGAAAVWIRANRIALVSEEANDSEADTRWR